MTTDDMLLMIDWYVRDQTPRMCSTPGVDRATVSAWIANRDLLVSLRERWQRGQVSFDQVQTAVDRVMTHRPLGWMGRTPMEAAVEWGIRRGIRKPVMPRKAPVLLTECV
jgi:hypothetical protein